MNVSSFSIPILTRKQEIPAGTLYEYGNRDVAKIIELLDWMALALRQRSPVTAVMNGAVGDVRRISGDSKSFIANYVTQHRENSSLDYTIPNVFWAFDAVYFYRNFFKCLLAAHHIRRYADGFPYSEKIIDLGCGVGTFSIACCLMSAFPESGKYNLLDVGDFQCFVADKLIKYLDLKCAMSVEKADVFNEFERRGTYIASYWLCGNKSSVLDRRDNDLKRILRDGFILLDYKKNVLEFMTRIENLPVSMNYLELTASVPFHLTHLVGGRDVTSHVLVVGPQPK